MSLFAKIQEAKITTVQEDSLGGFTVPTDVYVAVCKIAYIDKSEKGAMNVSFDFAILANGKERAYRETIYISNAAGEMTRVDKDGNTVPTFGYAKVDGLCLAICGKPLSELEPKVVSVQVAKDKVEPREVLTDLTGKRLMLAITEQTVNKTVKNDSTGKYDPIAETRDENTINKAFDADGMTPLELSAGKTEPKFMEDWKKRYQGKKMNKSKKVAGSPSGAVAGGVASSPAAINVFGS